KCFSVNHSLKLQLDDSTVHIWRVFLPELLVYKKELEKLLSDEEKKSAQEFKSNDNRSLFIIRRGVLRSLIQDYTGIQADTVEFSLSTWGKPEIVQKRELESLEFNATHSRNMMLVAFGRNFRLGVDLEYVDQDYPVKKVATRFFTSEESSILRELAPDEIVERFFEIWVRKEAFLKALGLGLSLPLNSFQVPMNLVDAFLDDLPLRSSIIEKDGALWSFSEITFNVSYKACLVTSPPPSAIRIFSCLPT
ncbi:MAG: 4'-phosphopantetheinyl transferase superfamily protein, partial [Pseudomonadota bacterium]